MIIRVKKARESVLRLLAFFEAAARTEYRFPGRVNWRQSARLPCSFMEFTFQSCTRFYVVDIIHHMMIHLDRMGEKIDGRKNGFVCA